MLVTAHIHQDRDDSCTGTGSPAQTEQRPGKRIPCVGKCFFAVDCRSTHGAHNICKRQRNDVSCYKNRGWCYQGKDFFLLLDAENITAGILKISGKQRLSVEISGFSRRHVGNCIRGRIQRYL